MATKKTKEEEIVLENSTVVLNDENPSIVDTTADDTTSTTPSTPSEDECKHDKDCTCEWGKCPKDTCERYYQNPDEVPTSQEYLYHLDDKGQKTEIKKANPNYKKEETPDPEPKPEPKPTPDEPSENPEVPSNDCGDEQDEPWAHDKVGDLREELRLHTGSVYNVVDAWLESLATETDDEKRAEIISHIAWHIPTGGPNSIKVHHKAKIVELLKAYKG